MEKYVYAVYRDFDGIVYRATLQSDGKLADFRQWRYDLGSFHKTFRGYVFEDDPSHLRIDETEAREYITLTERYFKEYGLIEPPRIDGPTVRCPVCGLTEFLAGYAGESWVCQNCGWFNDLLQLKNPSYSGGENHMSINQAREAYKKGEEVR